MELVYNTETYLSNQLSNHLSIPSNVPKQHLLFSVGRVHCITVIRSHTTNLLPAANLSKLDNVLNGDHVLGLPPNGEGGGGGYKTGTHTHNTTHT